MIKVEIITRYYFQKGKIKAALQNDPEIREAIGLLENKNQYYSVLKGTYIAKIADTTHLE